MTRTVFVEPSMSNSSWRTLWPGRELQRRGHDVAIFAQEQRHHGEVFAGETVILHITAGTWMETPEDIATPFSLVQRFLGIGVKLYLSFSDDLTQLWHVQTAPEDVTLRLRLFIADLPVIVRQAAGVIVTTPRLAEVYGRWANEVYVCEPYLPEWVFDLPRKPSNDRLGWMGTLDVHERDLEILRPRAADLPPMYLIGPGQAGVDLLRRWGARDVTAAPGWGAAGAGVGIIASQRGLYREMSACRAAVVPVITDGKVGRFNAGKSWIKPYEFMAVGVPTVASMFDPYRWLPGAWVAWDEGLVDAACEAYETRSAPEGQRLLRDYGWTMEQRGGDAWEHALGFRGK